MIDQWVLHVAATPHDVEDVLADLCLHRRARPVADRDYPARLVGRGSPDEPPAWLCFVRDELEQRGHRTQWCAPWCAHDSKPRAGRSGPAPHQLTHHAGDHPAAA
ncbi:hypothetical protein Acy02nite_35160 [Actinoplanes cyaneus]|uniref:Uncharacterized protein n=1 Tax=Actinoplanes cyaneus TaxID=52696 RepID=A0A919IP89_9ACTN|nr:hypothetical protein [Actinoplanes cyaneus]MCW2140317.1 hypothetical protein [Actinoplanes cyaneus]GID65635.1 hypothetical protein Acy02nite_35160 [Actinoplanes cyaneus]